MNENALLGVAFGATGNIERFNGFSREMQLKIIYLFMKVDGNCSENEIKRFDEICKVMQISENKKQEIIDFCECLNWDNNQDRANFAISEITKILNERFKTDSDYCEKDKLAQAFILWTLLNLAYADTEYTESERIVFQYLVDFWNVDNALVYEMNDTAKTVLTLTNQIEWLKTTNASYDYITSIIQEYESNIKTLFNNIEVAISEVNI